MDGSKKLWSGAYMSHISLKTLWTQYFAEVYFLSDQYGVILVISREGSYMGYVRSKTGLCIKIYKKFGTIEVLILLDLFNKVILE